MKLASEKEYTDFWNIRHSNEKHKPKRFWDGNTNADDECEYAGFQLYYYNKKIYKYAPISDYQHLEIGKIEEFNFPNWINERLRETIEDHKIFELKNNIKEF